MSIRFVTVYLLDELCFHHFSFSIHFLVIEPRINSANESLARVINDWSLVNISLDNLQTNANVLQNKFNSKASERGL